MFQMSMWLLHCEERIWIILDLKSCEEKQEEFDCMDSLWIEECRSFLKCTLSQIA